MGKKRRTRLSMGTLLMLLLTVLVLAGCVCFLTVITGSDLYERTGDFLRTLSEQVVRPIGEAVHAPEGSARTASPTADVSASPTASPSSTVSITLAAAGTVYAPEAVRQSAQAEDGYDFNAVFAGLGSMLSDADLAIATLETTVAGEDKGYGNYNTSPQLLDGLRSVGIDLLALATEHALDKGYEGLDITVSELTARGLSYAGVNPDGGVSATMLSVQGVQVAVLAYAYGLSDEGKEKTKSDEQGVLATLDMQRMVQDIRQARSDGANLVIVLPHWGTKNKQETPETLRTMAYALAEAGADIIWGTHPNVAQGTERLSVTRADGLTYETVVCYSLGCLLTDARASENTAGMIAHLQVTYEKVTRRVTLGTQVCTPVYIARQRENGQYVYRVVDAEDADMRASLDAQEQEAAKAAMERIRQAAAQEEEGQG